MEKRLFTELGLSPELLKAVEKMGFEEASPIQTAVIPTILAGRDVVGQSSTGSGKTAAYALPLLQRLAATAPARAVPALVLVPTRELAAQIAASFTARDGLRATWAYRALVARNLALEFIEEQKEVA